MGERIDDTRRIAVALTPEEIEGLLCLLLRAQPSVDVTEEFLQRLLCRVGDAQRAAVRRSTETALQ